ncbi:hypothetical protein MNBD_GAMMA10-1032 [hydrothermal vent metagenome]|uniref:Uncharacterized protein n=1 Tax=hydrothermal vent metagenome TaxID=652676 RepID=A0A3B0XU92_9ZZZZ
MNSYNIKVFFIALLSLAVLIATISSWFIGELQVVAAFFVAVIVIFVIAGFFAVIASNRDKPNPFRFLAGLAIMMFVVLVATPVHFIFLMPLYYALKEFDYPIAISLPVMSIIPYLMVFWFINREWGYAMLFIAGMAIVGYGVFDSFFILWLIEKFKFLA